MVVLDTNGKGKGKTKGKDKDKKGRKGKKKGKCFIYGSEEHWMRDCPNQNKGQDKSKDEKGQPGPSANIVAVNDESGDESLAAKVGYTDEPAFESQVKIFDSGSSRHISPYQNSFIKFEAINPYPLQTANCQRFHAIGKGDMTLSVPNGNNMSILHLKNVLYSPEAGYTLISIGRLNDDGYSTIFSDRKCIISKRDGNQVAEIQRNDKGLYKFPSDAGVDINIADESSLNLVHHQLGHISLSSMQRLAAKNLITGIKVPEAKGSTTINCDSCIFGKATRSPIIKIQTSQHAKGIGDEIHSDVWGPARTATKRGRCYYVTFTDDYSRWTYIESISWKSSVPTNDLKPGWKHNLELKSKFCDQTEVASIHLKNFKLT